MPQTTMHRPSHSPNRATRVHWTLASLLVVAAAAGCQAAADMSVSTAPAAPVGLEFGVVNASAPIGIASVEHSLTPRLVGPQMHTLFSAGEITGNPVDDNYSRYVRFSPRCSFMAYDPAYLENSLANEYSQTLLKERVQTLIAGFRMTEIMNPASERSFTDALKAVTEPILFPVHMGETENHQSIDEGSGLRPGDSQAEFGTFRGFFHEHTLTVDARRKTLRLGDGPPTSFRGDETDLRVRDGDGMTIYVDVTCIDSGFRGELPVGVMGRVRRVFPGDRIAQ